MLVWLLGLIPAAIATLFRNRWLLFVGGFFTFGLLWFVGALVRDPDGPVRADNLGWLLVAIAVGVLVLGLFGARPAPVLGIDGDSLQSSFGGADILSLGLEPESCERKRGDWICFRYDNSRSGSVSYRVEVDSFGCWEAKKTEAGSESPKQVSGCATLFDFVF